MKWFLYQNLDRHFFVLKNTKDKQTTNLVIVVVPWSWYAFDWIEWLLFDTGLTFYATWVHSHAYCPGAKESKHHVQLTATEQSLPVIMFSSWKSDFVVEYTSHRGELTSHFFPFLSEFKGYSRQMHIERPIKSSGFIDYQAIACWGPLLLRCIDSCTVFIGLGRCSHTGLQKISQNLRFKNFLISIVYTSITCNHLLLVKNILNEVRVNEGACESPYLRTAGQRHKQGQIRSRWIANHKSFFCRCDYLLESGQTWYWSRCSVIRFLRARNVTQVLWYLASHLVIQYSQIIRL